jgi:hypothetical protein
VKGEGEDPRIINIYNSQGIQVGAGNKQDNAQAGRPARAPLTPETLSHLQPRAAASRLRSLSDDELVDFFARAKAGDVRATLAALLELDEDRAITTLGDIGHPRAAELISAVYLEASPPGLPGAAHRHPLGDLTRRLDSAEVKADRCPACAASLDRRIPVLYCRSCNKRLVTDLKVTSPVPPDAILPFKVDNESARAAFEHWVSSRPFAPTSLRAAEAVYIEAVYLPYWSFSATRITDYVGQRGATYKQTESGERKYGEGNETEWGLQRPGTVIREFANLLVSACSTTPATPSVTRSPSLLGLSAPWSSWPVDEAVTYRERLLGDAQAIQHDVEPASAFAVARQQMDKTVMRDCKADIGGDDQKVEGVSTNYRQATYALVLLPAWSLSYRHNGREWRCVINGYTGKMKGERPVSAAKIWLAVVAVLAIIAALVAIPTYFLH